MQFTLWNCLKTAAIAAAITTGLAACTPTSNTSSSAGNPAAATSAAKGAPAAPAAPSAQAPATARSGQFVGAEHPTQGGVSLIEENGRRYLELDSAFQTDAGPDLFIVLHKASDILATAQAPAYPLAEGDYVELAPLQSTAGTQRYEIPDAIALSDYRSVAIWCRQFNATFGAAMLM